ncbi:MAG: hypothetical protein K2Q14_00205, partial [Gammaproteobacteria bacterium]|nr:hypothetical protein [Gammaproteobacteria bacterium]
IMNAALTVTVATSAALATGPLYWAAQKATAAVSGYFGRLFPKNPAPARSTTELSSINGEAENKRNCCFGA